jgi:hypothetical protein
MVPLLFYVCNVSKANILSYGLEIMMFWVCNNGGDGTDPITPLQVRAVGFDATYDFGKYTDVWWAKEL